ncbi:MAG: tyrosinase family protein [Rhodospirillaceae bacterium]
MSKKVPLRVRRSLEELQDAYENGKKKPLETLMRAWKGIKELPPDDPNSFFMIGGYHGEPFRGAGWGSASYWGGYCNHGNILFPTWHRMYVLRLEDALRSIPGCADVSLPYWDETSPESLEGGIPWALTQKDFVLDGETIANPLRSFVLNRDIVDHLTSQDADYSKPKGYETVRYPLSGLVGTEQEIEETEKHNAQYPDYDENVRLLNQNIVNWLGSSVVVNGETIPTNVARKYQDCLDAPNYTVFSNTTSSAQWKDDTGVAVRSLESPHNNIHLAVGGYDVGGDDFSPIAGANGDMGENDTAGLDPIFFFHHCYIDRLFWLWQKKHKATDRLEIIPHYPGTNSVDTQGPTPGTVPNSWLTLESPLDPFKKKGGRKERPYTSLDCINIEKQLGYTYGPGSLQSTKPAAKEGPTRTVTVRGINRARIRGSFLIQVFAHIGGKKRHVGSEGVLSRWHVEGCANCQTHLEARASVSLRGALARQADSTKFEVEVRTRDGLLSQPVSLKLE